MDDVTEDRTRCEETVAAVDDYVAGTLDPERVAAFEAHVAVCEACHVALEDAQEAAEGEGVLPETEVDEEVAEGGVDAGRKPTPIRWIVLFISAVLVIAFILFVVRVSKEWRRSEVLHNLDQMGFVFRTKIKLRKNLENFLKKKTFLNY